MNFFVHLDLQILVRCMHDFNHNVRNKYLQCIIHCAYFDFVIDIVGCGGGTLCSLTMKRIQQEFIFKKKLHQQRRKAHCDRNTNAYNHKESKRVHV